MARKRDVKEECTNWIIRRVVNFGNYHVLLCKQVENYETHRHVAGSEGKLEMYAEIFSGILNRSPRHG